MNYEKLVEEDAFLVVMSVRSLQHALDRYLLQFYLDHSQNQCREMKPLLLNDIELSWKLHLLEHLFQIFTYKYGIVVTF